MVPSSATMSAQNESGAEHGGMVAIVSTAMTSMMSRWMKACGARSVSTAQRRRVIPRQAEGVRGAISPEGAGACQRGGMSGVAGISGREEGTTSDVMQKGAAHS